ncbi:FAD/NAD(P)-binding domain-containing protein [Trametopsis cervina]|nr:FAD/NAD(P)-binding domain-containing protein [Trametopsis cervina]
MTSGKTALKTVAVLGGSYGGKSDHACNGAARVLASRLPHNWRVVLIDRNSHSNHLYVLPRFTVIPDHEHKGFIPYDHLYKPQLTRTDPPVTDSRHLVLQATVKALTTRSVDLSRTFPEHGINEGKLDYDFLVYALGSHSPDPINLWTNRGLGEAVVDGSKPDGIEWLKRAQGRIRDAPSVLIVGGGALGIQYAGDIAEKYPGKHVTLLHSRPRLLPKYNYAMHTQILAALHKLGVEVILNERLVLSSPGAVSSSTQEQVLKSTAGREISARLVLLCTGQRPNTELISAALPECVIPSGPKAGAVQVTRTLQAAIVDHEEDSPESLKVAAPHIFAIGDVANAFGAIHAGHNAHAQGLLAANNILKLVGRMEASHNSVTELMAGAGTDLEEYTPGPPGIKVSLGLHNAIYQRHGEVGTLTDQPLDWEAAFMWKAYGFAPDLKEEDMYV